MIDRFELQYPCRSCQPSDPIHHTLALWTVTVYLVRQKKNFWIMLIPALFMTTVCSTYVFISRQMLHLPEPLAYGLGIACLVVASVWFAVWYRKESQK